MAEKGISFVISNKTQQHLMKMVIMKKNPYLYYPIYNGNKLNTL
jgi:hypothetical protein